jgi:hypothetical protein
MQQVGRESHSPWGASLRASIRCSPLAHSPDVARNVRGEPKHALMRVIFAADRSLKDLLPSDSPIWIRVPPLENRLQLR